MKHFSIISIAIIAPLVLGYALVQRTDQLLRPDRKPGQGQPAPAGFDTSQPNDPNCSETDPLCITKKNFADDLAEFDKVDLKAPDGLGPVYNAQACRECHQNPVSGGASQVVEQRAGHLDANGKFFDPQVRIDGDVIRGRSLINDRAIASRAQERVPEGETIRTNRLSLNVLGDGFVEAIDDAEIIRRRDRQCFETTEPRGICGVAIWVPVLEANQNGANNEKRLGRFGWKDQHASLLSFAADAYLNEMGITTRLQPDEVTKVDNPTECKTAAECTAHQDQVSEPNNPRPGDTDPRQDIDKFAEFMRGTKVPPGDPMLGNSNEARNGKVVFDRIHCNTCHDDQPFTTSPPGTPINNGQFRVTTGVGSKAITTYSDFLLHDVGTGDNVAIAGGEHYSRPLAEHFCEIDAVKKPVLDQLPKQYGACRSDALQRAATGMNFEALLSREKEKVKGARVGPGPNDGGSLCDYDAGPEPSVDPDRAAIPFARPFFQRDECDAHFLAANECSAQTSLLDRDIQCTANKLRTPPLWGLHMRTRLMHDGNSVQITDAILRHAGEARPVIEAFKHLTEQQRNDLIVFLKSL
jgi:CxxC motif-containing protein (DUF1111 family)